MYNFLFFKKRLISILLFFFVLNFFGFNFSIFSQERVKSLGVRQFEIEEAIRNGLKYYLEPKDYVLRVKLFGEERAVSMANETLPGFGQLNDSTNSTGAKYWEIKRMRVDLVMHKEVSPSVNTYIGEIVPILSGLDYERGDEFIFVPILPSESFPEKYETPSNQTNDFPDPMAKAIGEESSTTQEMTKPDDGVISPEEDKILEEEPFWLRMSDIEKILAATLIILILLFFWVLWKLKKIKDISIEKKGLPALMPPEQTPQLPSSSQEGLVPAVPDQFEKILGKKNSNDDDHINDVLLNEENERLIQEIIKQLIGREDWKQELVHEMSRDKQSMEMLTQLIATFGMTTSRKLFSGTIAQNTYLDLEKLSQEANPSQDESNAVLKDVQKFLLTKQLTDPEQSTTNPFGFMDELTTSQIGFLIKDEPAKIKAFVIVRMESEEAAELFRDLPKDERTNVALEMGKLHDLPLELVEKIGYNLAEKARKVPDEDTVGVDGIKFIADVLSDLDNNTRDELINGMRTTDVKMSEDIESNCFIFESLPEVPKDILQEIVRKLQPDTVITAISGSTSKVKESAIMCFPEKSRAALVSSLKTKTPSSEEIRNARKMFTESMRQMVDAGRLDLKEVNTNFSQRQNQIEN
tara:strand:- start:2208 stop:4118 length:1911 start_codon:yes stop_codon:yes gene_type:complete